MPYHIKRHDPVTGGNVYYKADGDQWTNVYADRKVYSSEADCDAQMSNPLKFVNGFPMKLNGGFAKATKVTE